MNAPDNHPDLTLRDADLLAGIDRALTYPGLVTDEPESLGEFCAYLAATTPTADPVFHDLLQQRLLAALKQQPERAGLVARFISLVSPSRRQAKHSTLQAAPWRIRWASLLLALLVAGGGAGAYLHGQGPTPVDAQAVLHRAAATSPGADEVTHATYRLSADGGLTGTADVWIGFDGGGVPDELSLNVSMSQDGHPARRLSGGVAAAGPGLGQIYNSAPGVPMISPSDSPSQVLEGIIVGTMLAQKLSKQPDAFSLQKETLDGVPVYALQPNGDKSATFYFNAQSYVLQGADWVQAGKSWQVRLDPGSYRMMPRTSAPASAFPSTRATGPGTSGETGGVAASGAPSDGVTLDISLSSRAGAGAAVTISVSGPALKGASIDLMPALAAACNTTPLALATTWQGNGKSLFVACQATNPHITAVGLVSALIAHVAPTLDAEVNSGAISSAQESSCLAGLRDQLTHLLDGSMSLVHAGASTRAEFQQP